MSSKHSLQKWKDFKIPRIDAVLCTFKAKIYTSYVSECLTLIEKDKH